MKTTLASLAFALVTLASNNAFGACSIAKPLDCVGDPIGAISKITLNHFDVNVKNLCSKPIWVGAYYKRMGSSSGQTSTLSLAGTGDVVNGWYGQGWWKLNVGESKLIAQTQNGIVYFHAYSDDQTNTWGSASETFPIEGVNYPTVKTNMGNSYTSFTQTFTCH